MENLLEFTPTGLIDPTAIGTVHQLQKMRMMMMLMRMMRMMMLRSLKVKKRFEVIEKAG